MILFNALDHYTHGSTCVVVRATLPHSLLRQTKLVRGADGVVVLVGGFIYGLATEPLTTNQPAAVVDIDL